MAKNNETLFTRLGQAIMGGPKVPQEVVTPNRYQNIDDRVIYSTTDKDAYEQKLLQLKQQKLLSYQWVKAERDNSLENLAGYTATKLMYRDCDLMDGMPEIATALDIYQEEACCFDSSNKMLNIYSKSKRVKSILEDLFVNRLNVHVTLPMFVREMCKYGNAYALLNINYQSGITGWMKLPVYEIDRIENGYDSPYTSSVVVNDSNSIEDHEVRFLWTGHNENMPYRNWQIAHFRMLNDAFFLPYGTSCLHKARRAWRMWSMMEDAMLIYRLDKSIERRVYKIYVGAIDENDVQAYVQQVADAFKRTPIIDPATGQVDLRKNFMDVSQDYFIPVRSENSPNPIETLSSAKNETSMDDIEYMQNKVFAALRVPKTFLNFQEAQGKGQNLALMDVRFARLIVKIQQFVLMELNKVAMIHLYLLGLTDELSNFTLSLNNPSSQIEMAELEELTKRVGVATSVLADPGIGMPIFSLHKTLRDVMKMSENEIKDMLGEVRLEKAMAAELANTATIIKKTGMFDSVDRIYGDYDAMNAPQQAAPQGDQDAMGGMGGGGGAFGGAPMPMDDMGDDMSGGGDMDMSDAAGADAGAPPAGDAGAPPAGGPAPIMEQKSIKANKARSFTEKYFNMLNEHVVESIGTTADDAYDFELKTATLNEQVKNIMTKIEGIIKPTTEEKIDEEILSQEEDKD